MSRNYDNTNYDLTPAASQLTSHDSISTPTRTVRQSSGLSRFIKKFLQNPYLLTLLIWGKIFGTLPISQHFSSKSLSFNLTDLGRYLNHTPTTSVPPLSLSLWVTYPVLTWVSWFSTSTSILYSSPSYSRIMSRRHCGCRGLLVGKRVQEVW